MHLLTSGFIACFCVLVGCASPQQAPQPGQGADDPSANAKVGKKSSTPPALWPTSARGTQTDDYHGTSVADPYRWLEDPDSSASRAWITAQNQATERQLAAITARPALRERLETMWRFDRRAAPRRVANKFFQLRQVGLQNQSVLHVADSELTEGRVLLDPNALAADGTVALKDASISPDGRRVAWMTSTSGSDWSEIRVRDVETGKDTADHLQWVKFSGIAWAKDGSGFYYSAYDAPAAGQALRAVNAFHKLYFHPIGGAQGDDLLIRESRAHKDWGFGGDVSDDGRLLIVPIWRGATKKNALLIGRLPLAPAAKHRGKPSKSGARTAPTGGAPTAWVEIDLSFEHAIEVVGNVGDQIYVQTDIDAERSRIARFDLSKPALAGWQTVVAESKSTLTGARIVGGKLVVQTLIDAHSELLVYDLAGKALGTIPLPTLGTVAQLSGDSDDDDLYLSFTSFAWPVSLWKVKMADLKTTKLWAPTLPFAPEDFVTEQHFAKSKDGTDVPFFLIRRKDVDKNGERPLWLHAYGGFNIAMTPEFSVERLTWVAAGGVYALANLRGGGEYGDAWHQAGMLGNKQNVFDDFFAVAEQLHRDKWASPATTAIVGGSNGGLLVGAAITQRPALFGAALPAVGVMDMLRYHTWTIGWAWVPEYGASTDANAFKWLHAYSPLHNCRPQRYPATLVTTADHDDRVVPAHSFKFTAALQHAQQGPAPVLIRIEEKAGHGAGKPTSKRIDEAADKMAFLVNAIGAGHFAHLSAQD